MGKEAAYGEHLNHIDQVNLLRDLLCVLSGYQGTQVSLLSVTIYPGIHPHYYKIIPLVSVTKYPGIHPHHHIIIPSYQSLYTLAYIFTITG